MSEEQEELLWQETLSYPLTSANKEMLSTSSQEHFALFDPARALRELKGATEPEVLWEICCSPNSNLAKEAQRQGFTATRWNWETGFDLGNKAKVDKMIEQIPRCKPTRLWASPKCTAVSSIQNLNQRNDPQRLELQKKRMRTRREIKQLIRVFKAAYSRNPGKVHFYMEWPKSATIGWNMREWEDLRRWMMQHFGQPLYTAEIHGCMFGLKDKHGVPLNKPWKILTTDYDFSISGTVVCDNSHEHRHVLGLGTEAVRNTAFYPPRMVHRIVQLWKKQWYHFQKQTC